MKSFKIDEYGDLVIEDNNIKMIEGQEELKQSLWILLTTNKEEFFLNKIHGLKYDLIQRKNPDLERIRLEIIKTLNQEERILNIEKLDLDFNRSERKLYYYFKVLDIYYNAIEDKGELQV